MTSTSTSTTPQKHRPFPIFVADGKRSEKSDSPPKPDSHPYAIRSTASGLLTRSNSTTSHGSHAHAYIPTSPSPNSKHRYTKSEVSSKRSSSILGESPRPLPIPPSMESPTKDGFSSSEDTRPLTYRTKRADTLPTLPPLSSPVKLDDLPSNPKVWSTSQLASYLITALRVKSSDSIPVPVPVARDIAVFIKEARLTGRAFIKLTEEDLDAMGVNTLWREALLNASKNLRQNVVKGRIWGFDTGEDLEFRSSRGRRLPFARKEYNSSSSSVDMSDSADTTPSKGRGHGRVRSMISSLERNESHGSGFNEGLGLYSAPWADEEPLTSGSDASEADNEGSDSSPPSAPRSLPAPPITPPIDLLDEIPGDVAVEIAQPEGSESQRELTVQELLQSEGLERSWGAKAWEEIDMNAGVTVKRLVDDNDTPSKERVLTPNASRSGSARKKAPSPQIKDIFSRPLPRPPILDGGDVLSSAAQASKVDHGVQSEEEIVLKSASRDVGTQTDEIPVSPGQAEWQDERQRTLDLVEELKARLAATEKRLEDYDSQDAKQEATSVEHRSCAVETDSMVTTQNPMLDDRDGVEEASTEASGPLTVSRGLQEVIGFGRSMIPKKDWDPLDNGLSSYVLMVGVGVCAVVLQTLLKRLAGKR
ncbi:hypothetical protein SCHPADRAFT_937068 [Schizopora paradoxa]|uniref:SAM domain-containing protein n=1 Tax=Schizopora paradoxa TaxID=27342 RepID=A0A0H2S6Q4_9AGAM|nr:hypothetical protein SCHPADRAFT_937068 [Schizopora paradoxa]